MIDLNTEQLRWVCAMFERECPGAVLIIAGQLDTQLPHDASCQCKGTSHIPLLEGVREECVSQNTDDEGKHWFSCTGGCHGLGWIPTENLGKWLETTRSIRFDDWTPVPILWPSTEGWVFQWQGKDGWGEGDTPIAAVILALYRALLPVACNADGVIAWVKGNIHD